MIAHWKSEVCFNVFGGSLVNPLPSAILSIFTDTYHQYQKVKNNVHGKEDVPDSKVEMKLEFGSGPKEVQIGQTLWH